MGRAGRKAGGQGQRGAAGRSFDQAIRVFGLPRVGNHAVIDWMIRNTGAGPHVFLNNCTPRADPFSHFGQAEIDGARFPGSRAGRADAARALSALTATPNLLISYEQTLPGLLPDAEITPGFGAERFSGELLIWRSFVNWLASLLVMYRRLDRNRGKRLPADTGRVILAAVMDYRTTFLARDTRPETQLCYDRWKASETYRAEMLETLGLPGRDLLLGDMSWYGGGSSFDGQRKAAEALGTEARYKTLRWDAEYRLYLSLAAQDTAFIEALEPYYPTDAQILRRIGRQNAGWLGRRGLGILHPL